MNISPVNFTYQTRLRTENKNINDLNFTGKKRNATGVGLAGGIGGVFSDVTPAEVLFRVTIRNKNIDLDEKTMNNLLELPDELLEKLTLLASMGCNKEQLLERTKLPVDDNTIETKVLATNICGKN